MRKRADYVASTSNKFFPRKCGSLEERFWSKVSPEPNTGCWLWGGDSNGSYGTLGIYDNGARRNIYAHRFSYVMHSGQIPDDLQIDHRCRMKFCVNPDHLQVVTPLQNTMNTPPGIRGNNQIRTHCRKGHPLYGENLKFDYRGGARCATCAQSYFKSWNKRQKVVRPYIPYPIRIEVVMRQLVRTNLAQLVSRPCKGEHQGQWLARQLRRLFGDELCHLDHDPALVNRPFNKRTGKYTPEANDPKFLVYRTKTDHDLKTRVRGDGALRSDHGQLRYNKRVERNREKRARPKPSKLRKATSQLKRGADFRKHKWPSRPMRGASNWPKKGTMR